MSDDTKTTVTDPTPNAPTVPVISGAAPAQPSKQVPAAKPEEGTEKVQFVRLTAVHGYIQHPYTLESFDIGHSKKVPLDGWVKIQMEAGKLVESDD